MTRTTQILTCPTSRCSFPRLRMFHLTILQWSRSHKLGGDPVQNVQCPSTDPQGSQAVMGPQETVQLVTHRARDALNAQRDTARRALPHQQGDFLAATHQHEVAARQNARANASSTARTRSRCAIFSVHTWVCVVFDGDCVFCLRNTGARAGPTTVWALWTQDNRGLMAAIVPRPCAVCINPSSQWTKRCFGFDVFHWCVSCTSWCLQSHDQGLMTDLVEPLYVPGRPRLHGQGQLSQIEDVRSMTASRTSVIPGSFPGGDAGPRGLAPLSPRELLK